ncbi:MAG: radical SAM protein, partial [Chloroflexi bacterium]|nr:radical SAM protein [Chloroflexota bacterium]
KNAERVEIGDYIPIAKRLPPPLREQEPIIDLIAAFTELDLDHQIMVYGARRLLYKGTAPYRKLGVRKYLWDNWRRDDCMPLWVFNALDDRMVDRRRVNIGFRYSKRKDCLPAIISLNRPLAKLLGYYLSEGYATGGRVEFCVGIHEHDLAQEIASLIQEAFGVPIRMRINYWKGHPSSIRVDARNKTLEAVFRDVFQAGVDSYTKKVPWFVFALDEESIAELLNAYFIGDGHVRRSVSGGKTRNVLSIESSTASEDLALGIQLLLLRLGIQACIRYPSGRKSYKLEFQVRASSEAFDALEGFISREGLNDLPESDPQGLVSFSGLYPTLLLSSLKGSDVPRIFGERISLRKLRDEMSTLPPFLRKLMDSDIHLLRVKRVESIEYQDCVYDLEVGDPARPYHTFMTGCGLVTHNCTFNCLFCQNWHYRQMSPRGRGMTAEELADRADARTYCVCYFGGDPTPQMPHALATSHILAERGVRICWETNGTMQPRLLEKAVQLSLQSGGCIKFDLKAYDESLHLALTGVSNKRTLENFARAARHIPERPDPPLVVASTLLVPGYVDAQEVSQIASFIASFDPTIPYALLGFHPHFYMPDLPRTSVRHADEAEAAAR